MILTFFVIDFQKFGRFCSCGGCSSCGNTGSTWTRRCRRGRRWWCLWILFWCHVDFCWYVFAATTLCTSCGGTVLFTYFRWLCCRGTSCTRVLQHECYPAKKLWPSTKKRQYDLWLIFTASLFFCPLNCLVIRVTLIYILLPSQKKAMTRCYFFRDDDPLSKLPLLQFNWHSTWFLKNMGYFSLESSFDVTPVSIKWTRQVCTGIAMQINSRSSQLWNFGKQMYAIFDDEWLERVDLVVWNGIRKKVMFFCCRFSCCSRSLLSTYNWRSFRWNWSSGVELWMMTMKIIESVNW